MNTLALVAHSARLMAEAAARDGFGVVAIDLFGDADTRAASQSWLPAGPPGAMRLQVPIVLDALRGLARRGDVAGWVAGAGCEGEPDLLAEGASLLPLIGCTPQAVQRVRDPLAFFDFLAAYGIAHPEVRSTLPADTRGWLVKDARGCGGWHIHEAALAAGAALHPQQYVQRRAAGTPMSATYCGNGREALLLGFNELNVRAIGRHPHVYCGAIGPLPLPFHLPEAAEQQVRRALRLLTAGMALQGLGSLDFLLDGEEVLVLEVNPRPPASMALYERHLKTGLMAAHVDACQSGQLPEFALRPPADGAVSGQQIVYAPKPLRLGAEAALALQDWPDCHDLPLAGTRFNAGDPLCSLGARGQNAAEVRARLRHSRTALLQKLESMP